MDGIGSHELFDLSKFSVFRCDRSSENSIKKSFGGVLISVNATYGSELLEIPNTNQIENVCVKAKIRGIVIYIYCGYIPPDKSGDVIVFQAHVDAIEFVCSLSNPTDVVLVGGDFNLQKLSWFLDEVNPILVVPNVVSSVETCLCDGLSGLGLNQINHLRNMNGRLLDLIYCSLSSDISVVASENPLVKEDLPHHIALEVHLELPEECPDVVIADKAEYCYDFSKANYDQLSAYINEYDFESHFSRLQDLNDMVMYFYYVLFIGFEWFVPKKKMTSSKHPPWYNRTLIHLLNKKNKAFRRYVASSRCGRLYNSYKFFRKKFANYQHFLYNEYLNRIQTNLRFDPKSFYKFAKFKSKSAVIPSLMEFNNVTASNISDICDLFADYFESVYCRQSSDDNIPTNLVTTNAVDIGSVVISCEMVSNFLLKINTRKSCGPDFVPPVFLKNCAAALSVPLTSLFNKSLSSGIFPNCWKVSFITAIFKSGSRRLVENYRGVTIQPTLAKVFEAIVCEVLSSQVKTCVSNLQHGFMKGRSTSTNLLLFSNFLRLNIQAKRQVDCIYTDFKKAFDRVDHNVLIAKLRSLGFHSNILQWIQSYLSGRSQNVKIRGFESRYFPVKSGVPQGSHLGPLLFILFINDVVDVFRHCKCLMFADDLKIFMTISNPIDVLKLQSDLNRLNDWCKRNKLYLNVQKCSIMSFYRKRNPILANYFIDDEELKRKTTVTDLGVIFDTKVTFKEHIDNIVTRSYSLLGYIKRTCYEFKSVYALKSVYCLFIRPILEYASVVWNPYYVSYSDRIESIQRKFLLFALRKLGWRRGFNMPSYVSRCKLIHLEPLSKRRLNASLFFIFDLLNGHIDSPEIYSTLKFNPPSRARVSDFFTPVTSRTNYGRFEPISYMCLNFNVLFRQGLYHDNMSRDLFRSMCKTSELLSVCRT